MDQNVPKYLLSFLSFFIKFLGGRKEGKREKRSEKERDVV